MYAIDVFKSIDHEFQNINKTFIENRTIHPVS